ncbi:hypothetical protein CVT24_004114 [Panaeolus cyanescens]|uniref:Uncharacterized protein n=1 Tax=Panaeolus cyanescens TaxID=181874 RepID=A0A409Y5X7_9AGAR|nr:hypothetical protein CVT24_004114 [Panaeolus cyanescens]
MNVLKTNSFFRPTSRPSSPAPALLSTRTESAQAAERSSRPLNKLSLSNFIRQTPSQSPNPAPSAARLIQDGSYLEMLSLKLSEAVSKALAQPPAAPGVNDQVAGKRPIPHGRGLSLGALISSELNAVQDNPHLFKAVLRSLQRPLTVLLTNLSAQLVPLLASPVFLVLPTVAAPASFPNPTQQHALSLAKFCEEMLQTFDALNLGTDADIRGDGLKSIRDGFVSLLNRVINPLITGVRNELTPIMEALERPVTAVAVKHPAATKNPAVAYHPSILALQTLMPVYAKALTACTSSTISHASLASLLISVLWKAMVALAHRQEVKANAGTTPPVSPLLTAKKGRGSPGASTTPPITPPTGRFTIKLPPSRPPSPPSTTAVPDVATDCKALYELLLLLPRPSPDNKATKLAREAVDEAYEGLRTLPALFDAVKSKNRQMQNPIEVAKELNLLTSEIPSLIALPIVLRAFGGPNTFSVSGMLGLTEDEYRMGCLSGFGRAEECAMVVSQRVMDVLQQDSYANMIVIQWLALEMIEIEEDAP